MHGYGIVVHILASLLQNPDDAYTSATSQPRQEQFHWTDPGVLATAFLICIDQEAVAAAGRDFKAQVSLVLGLNHHFI
jgi:hypothetical protein